MSTAYPLLLSGHDTIECAYYLAALPGCTLDYEKLAVEKEALRLANVRRPKAIQLGSEEFLLMPNGTKSGYPFLIENDYKGDFPHSAGGISQPASMCQD